MYLVGGQVTSKSVIDNAAPEASAPVTDAPAIETDEPPAAAPATPASEEAGQAAQ